jgi:hypothetical protein
LIGLRSRGFRCVTRDVAPDENFDRAPSSRR